MARESSGAWFWEARNAWFATTNGRRVPLGVKGPGNQQSAQQAWYRLMGGVSPTPHPAPAPAAEPTPSRPARLVPSQNCSKTSAATISRTPGLDCSQLVEAFLNDCAGRKAKGRLGTTGSTFTRTCTLLGMFPLDLTPLRVEDQARVAAADRQMNPKYGRGLSGKRAGVRPRPAAILRPSLPVSGGQLRPPRSCGTSW